MKASQPSKADGLMEVVSILVRDESPELADFAEDLKKAKKSLPRQIKTGQKAKIEALGQKVSKAIAGLKDDRAKNLTFLEATAFLRISPRRAQDMLRDFKRRYPDGYHLNNARRGTFDRFHYHLEELKQFLEDITEERVEDRSKRAREQWKNPKHLAIRQGKLRDEVRRREDILEDVLALVKPRLKSEPGARNALAALNRHMGALTRVGIDISVRLLPQFMAFLHAQVDDITVAATEPQLWLTNADGKVLDHAWWPIDHTTGQIRAVLEAGGTVTEMTLVEALRASWKGGDAWSVWSHIAHIAAELWSQELAPHQATDRHNDWSEKGRPEKNKSPRHVRSRT